MVSPRVAAWIGSAPTESRRLSCTPDNEANIDPERFGELTQTP